MLGRSLRDWPPRYAGHPGQGPMRRFSAMSLLRALPFAAELKTEVPSEFLQEMDQLEDGTRVVMVSCPCGREPEVKDNGTAICEGEDCGRVFLMLGERVWVARYDSTEQAEDPVD